VRRYQIGNKKPSIEGQTTQWPNENRQKAKGVIRSRKPKERQHNGQMKTDKRPKG